MVSGSQTPLDRVLERWRVFSGLEGEEDEEDDDEDEDVEDGVMEEEETMLEGSGTLVDAPSVATDTWKRPSVKPAAGGCAWFPPWTVSGLRALLNWASKLLSGCWV